MNTGARLDKPSLRPRKYKHLTFVWIRKDGVESPFLITRIEGNDLFVRSLRQDGGLGAEQSIYANSDAVRPALTNEFSLVVVTEFDRRKSKDSSFEISLPTPDGNFKRVGDPFGSRVRAVAHAREKYGADARGRVSIVNEVRS